RPHTIIASLEIPRGGAEGVIVAHGSCVGGYVLFVQNRRVHYVHNYVGIRELHLESTKDVPEGSVHVRFSFEPTGKPDFAKGRGTPGRAQLFFDDRPVGEMEFPVTVPLFLGVGSGLTVGRNPGSAISSMYQPPFPFTGKIVSVAFDLSTRSPADSNEER